ncbi:alpha/beta hydrolase [Ectothiorhodospira shaposhnikovii]|uniref:alpha/beta hydrolase n=1 Tax=Ectothiorhodospira shaposhnikovii TaxID=1054 RepID=UPI001EE8C445|nr:alpha/beta-hydrolase family protein [Ectothiorhodospira shaposhnikovii]MCG5514297.1 alpha/beta-hydrolase family protein [Ectothiorhodospira shaposhnikovii]
MYLSVVGLLVGTVFFAFSLTPSLLPRPFLIQGVISGLSFAAGYGLGVAGVWFWKYLELPTPSKRTVRFTQVVAGLLCVLITFSFIWQASEWQNSLRALMGIEELAGVQPVLLGVIAALVFVLMLSLARLFKWVFRTLSIRLHRYVPRRISQIFSITAAVFLFWTVINGVLVSSTLRVLDRSFQQLDALIDADLPHPVHAWQTGSQESLINWKDLGRQGRSFVAGGPTAEELSDFFDTPVPPPIRVYVGLNSADTPEQRARLALEELKRAGGFDRSILLLVTPTGTGWVDPSSQNTVEYLHRGDIATVVAQYSYLNSPLTLLTDQGYGAENARALFTEIYHHWRTLPPESRPRLFLRGLSLGSLNSDLSFDLFDIINDPFDGALWSGPPFRNETWRRVTAERDPGSPAWLPEFRGGSVVRFMNQEQRLNHGKEEWGTFRIVFLQYASDPITFFSPESAWKEPEWMREPRGPDVSPDLRWFPIVTMLQLAADMMVGTAPKGFGHEYAPTDYIHAWLALTEPEGWSESELQRLLALFD